MKTQGNQYGTHAFRVHVANAPRLRVPKHLRGVRKYTVDVPPSEKKA